MNLPTKITIARIALIPIMVVIYALKGIFAQYYILLTALFVIAACTDFVDGHIARKYNMVTDLGKFLDPVADKILVVAGMLFLIDMNILGGFIGVGLCILILTREFAIGVFRQIAAAKGSVLAADNLGKLKTIFTLISLAMLLLSPIKNLLDATIGRGHQIIYYFGLVLEYGGLCLFILASILTVVSGFNYVIKNKHVLKEEGDK